MPGAAVTGGLCPSPFALGAGRTRCCRRLCPPHLERATRGCREAAAGEPAEPGRDGCIPALGEHSKAMRHRQRRVLGSSGSSTDSPPSCAGPGSSDGAGWRSKGNKSDQNNPGLMFEPEMEEEIRRLPCRSRGSGAEGAASFRSLANTLVCFFPSSRSQLLNP